MDGGLRLDLNWLDYLLLALYFVTVLGVGFAARRAIRTSVDFFLSGRSLPAWVTGLAIVLTYISIGGLSSAIFVILAGLIQITVIGLVKVGGIDGLYDDLLAVHPSPVAALARTMAYAELAGPSAGLAEVDLLAADSRLAGYHVLPAGRAAVLTGNAAERAYLEACAADLR